MAGALVSPELTSKEHGEVEGWLEIRGREVHRKFLQGYFDVREKHEPQLESVVGTDGIERTHRRQGCERSIATVFGNVCVSRKSYGLRGEESLFPLDAQLNLSDDMYSDGIRRRVADEVTKISYDQAVESIEKTTGTKVPKRQVEELAVKMSQDFEAFYEHRKSGKKDSGKKTKSPEPLVLSFDGKGIVMQKDALRPATLKAAENEQHKITARLSKGEKRNRKRMATVATVYSIERHFRTPESIMGHEEPEITKRPRPTNKRVWASVERDSDQVIEEAFEEALGQDATTKRPWVILVDGQEQQLKQIKRCLKRRGIHATLILDFIHVLEYLWKAAYAFEDEGTNGCEEWVAERALRILQGKSSDVAAGIRRSATLRDLSPEQRAAADTCANYLLKYRDMLKYNEYLSEGFPIATGVIEGACRHLIKDRMDITGARWGLESAEAVLKLRSLQRSGDFDDYWPYHKQREQERNHYSRYSEYPLACTA
jgi:hypothetical protein